ncbi:MAG: hypothetical protein HDS35_05805 [Bacteroides sp.]|nr:hypothetical protein [Bacteroides sp.]
MKNTAGVTPGKIRGKIMFALGIALLLLGLALRISMRLRTHQSTKNLRPQPVGQRSMALEIIRLKSQRGFVESGILIASGLILVLLTGLFN